MRMFVALYPSQEARVHLEAALAEVRERLPTEDAQHIRWIPSERWHITLAFLAAVDPTLADRLNRALADVATEHAPLVDLGLTGSGVFGSTVWIGVAPTERGTAAERLAKATQRAARTCGIEVERRPWRAHLSIARIRSRSQGDAQSRTAAVVRRLADYSGLSWTATDITLVHSILDPHPAHIPVGKYALHWIES